MANRKPLKIVLLGDSGTGKTNLLSRVMKNRFDQKYNPSTGMIANAYDIHVGSQIVETDLWELAGEEKYRCLADACVRDADGILFMYDMSNLTTFENVVAWLKHLRQAASPKTVIKLVGNKNDLQDRMVPSIQAYQFAIDNGLSYIETSALNGSNVHLAFESMAQEINVTMHSESERSEASSRHDDDQQKKPFQVVLIDIEQAAHDNILCVEKSLDEANLEFIAISYRWGEVDEQVIDTKLGYMASVKSFHLKHFYQLCRDMMRESDLQSIKYVWVDAICVDQNNQTRRKATIYQMSNIYRRAAYILAVPDLHLFYLLSNGICDYRLWYSEYDIDEFIYYLLHEKADNLVQITANWFDKMGIPKAARKQLTIPYCKRFLKDLHAYDLHYTDDSCQNSCYDSTANNDYNTPRTLLDCIQRSINTCHDHSENTTMVYENSDCALCSHQMDMRKYQKEDLDKNETSPDQKWLVCVLKELQYDKYRRLVDKQTKAFTNFLEYFEYLIRDWSSRVWVISEYNIAKTKQSRKMKFWFLSLDITWKDSEKLDFFVFDFDKTETNASFSESDIPYNNVTREALDNYDNFQSTVKSYLNEKSFFKMMLDSKASRNEDRFYAIFPSTEYKNMITSREVVSSWKIDNIVSVKLKLYELMTTKDKLELLYLTACNRCKSICTFPAFAHANVVDWKVTPVKEQNEDGHPCNFDWNNNSALRLVPPDVSLESKNGSHFYKLRLSPKMYYAIHDETDHVMELFDKIFNDNGKLCKTLEISYVDDELAFVSIPIYMYNIDCLDTDKDIEHIALFGSFKVNKWLLCDKVCRYPESYTYRGVVFVGRFSWKSYENSDGNTSFDIY